jgi:hypothetical protein
MEQGQSRFEGWAVVEMFGHQKIAGFVTTENFGAACLFRVDVPELPERDVTITRPEWVDTPEYSGYAYAGSVLRREAVPGFTKMVGPGAVYSMNPCSEVMVRDFLDKDRPRRVVPVTLVTEKPKQLTAPVDAGYDSDDDEDSSF